MDDKANAVLDTLQKAGKPLKTAELASATGLDAKEIGKILKALKKDGKVTSPKNCFYAPA